MKNQGLYGTLLALSIMAMVAVDLIPGFYDKDFSWRPWAWGATMALMIIALALIGKLMMNDWRGVLIDSRNVMSLSRLQLVVWSILVISGILAAGVINTVVNAANPLILNIPTEIWTALGISGTSFIATPLILGQKSGTISSNPNPIPGTPGLWRWSDIFLGDVAQTNPGNSAASDDTTIDFSKVQQFFFTVVVIAVYAIRLGFAFATQDRITFPPIDAGFVTLLGISNAAYLIHKAS